MTIHPAQWPKEVTKQLLALARIGAPSMIRAPNSELDRPQEPGNVSTMGYGPDAHLFRRLK